MTTEPDRLEVMQALKPCPFCGGEASLRSIRLPMVYDCDDVCIYCTNCDVDGPHILFDQSAHSADDLPDLEAEAITAWNARIDGIETLKAIPEWRCVNCKTVVVGHLKPDRCPECNWCIGFAEINRIETNSRTGDTVGETAKREHVMPGDPHDICNIALQWYLKFDFGYPHSVRESNIAVEGFKDGYRAAMIAPQSITPPEVGGELVERATSEEANRHLVIRSPLNNVIFSVLRGYRASNMADEDGNAGYPLVDLLSNPAPADIGTGEMQMVELADEIEIAIATLSTPEVVDGTAGLVEALEKARNQFAFYGQQHRAKLVDSTPTTAWLAAQKKAEVNEGLVREFDAILSQNRGVSNQVVRASAQEGTALSSQATEPQASPPCGLQSTDAALIEALAPFSLALGTIADADTKRWPDNETIEHSGAAEEITWGDLRRARAAFIKAEAKS